MLLLLTRASSQLWPPSPADLVSPQLSSCFTNAVGVTHNASADSWADPPGVIVTVNSSLATLCGDASSPCSSTSGPNAGVAFCCVCKNLESMGYVKGDDLHGATYALLLLRLLLLTLLLPLLLLLLLVLLVLLLVLLLLLLLLLPLTLRAAGTTGASGLRTGSVGTLRPARARGSASSIDWPRRCLPHTLSCPLAMVRSSDSSSIGWPRRLRRCQRRRSGRWRCSRSRLAGPWPRCSCAGARRRGRSSTYRASCRCRACLEAPSRGCNSRYMHLPCRPTCGCCTVLQLRCAGCLVLTYTCVPTADLGRHFCLQVSAIPGQRLRPRLPLVGLLDLDGYV